MVSGVWNPTTPTMKTFRFQIYYNEKPAQFLRRPPVRVEGFRDLGFLAFLHFCLEFG